MAKTKKHLEDVYTHTTTNTGRLNFMADWAKTHLDADPEDEVKHYRIPGLKAVVLIKPDDFNGLPDRIKGVLKTEDQLQEDFEALKSQIIADYKASKASIEEE